MEQTALELGDAPDTTFSVLEPNSAVRDALREAFPAEVWVRGEVQGLRRTAPGHTYFSLVEKAGRGDRVLGRLDVALFAEARRVVERMMRDVPGAELGDDVEVRIRGRVTVYPATGRLQLVMSAIDPVFTVGGIAANRERVMRTLAAEGLLDRNARLPLPLVPLRVGLVTSSGSAAYHDFVEELVRSRYAWQVGVVDVRVQGNAAARRIKWGLGELARRDVDVVVLVRGGGSRADLAPFDTELVARAIAAMPVPVITGVGHEVDRSVADEVAHQACKTPTACAQALVDRVREFLTALDGVSHRIVGRGRSRGSLAARELDGAVVALRHHAATVPGRQDRRLDRSAARVRELGRRAGREAEGVLSERRRILTTHAGHRLAVAAMRLDAASGTLQALDPRRVLERGYTLTRQHDGRIVTRAERVHADDVLITQFADGRATSRVAAVEPAGGSSD